MDIKILSIPTTNQYKMSFKRNEQINTSGMERTPANDSFEMTVGYVNDIHGQANNMLRILSGIKGDLILSGGDNGIGDEGNKDVNMSVIKFMNSANIKGTALGNHDLDTTQSDFVDTQSYYDGDIIAVNLKQEKIENQDKNDVDKFKRTDITNTIKKSSVVEVKGEKIGLVGAAPVDIADRFEHPDYHTDCSVYEMEKTIEHIQKEVNDLKKQGINKIFLLSHLGHKRDKVVAQNTSGIDVIIGGHTHELIEDVIEGKNLLYSESDEPVVITEAGRDGKNFGILNLTFDKDGIITKVQNNIANSLIFPKSMIHEYEFNKILGKPEDVGFIKESPLPPTSLLAENPHANFMCDAMRYELGTDIGLWNNGGARNYFHEGYIDSRDIRDIAPFKDFVAIADVSEKTLVDTFKRFVKDSYENANGKPGLMAVSGLKYTVNPQKGELVDLTYIDKNGQEHAIDINNPSEDKTYKVAADEFIMFGFGDFNKLAEEENSIKYDFCKDYLTCEYIKHLNKPIVINQTGRIKFEN